MSVIVYFLQSPHLRDEVKIGKTTVKQLATRYQSHTAVLSVALSFERRRRVRD